MLGTEAVVPVLMVDNQSAIALSKNPVFHNRSKHIDVWYHYLRECIKEGLINVVYTVTDEQLADLLTKALGRVRFLEQRHKIGMMAVGDRVED
jgi:hypothetical protein